MTSQLTRRPGTCLQRRSFKKQTLERIFRAGGEEREEEEKLRANGRFRSGCLPVIGPEQKREKRLHLPDGGKRFSCVLEAEPLMQLKEAMFLLEAAPFFHYYRNQSG